MRVIKAAIFCIIVPIGLFLNFFIAALIYVRDVPTAVSLTKGYILGATGQLDKEEWMYLYDATKVALRIPEIDAIIAVRRSDYRLMGMAGIGLFYPGIPEDYDNIATDEKDLSVMILGAGDCSMNKTDRIYQLSSYNYAYRYNKLIWPFLARTMPGPALGIKPNRSSGESYYCFSSNISQTASGTVTHSAWLRLSINHRFDLLEGDVVDKAEGSSEFRIPYTMLEGKITRKGNKYFVKYRLETPINSHNLSSSIGEAKVVFEGKDLIFQGRRFSPCPQLDDGSFYMKFAGFYYQHGE